MTSTPSDSLPNAAPLEARGGGVDDGAERTLARMEREGYRFEFFQAVRLIAAARGGPESVGGLELRREAVRVGPDPASVFPAADVRHVRRSDGPEAPVRIDVGFGGLYGVDAALPATFHDRISTLGEGTRPLRDFLDLIGHRPYAQLWRGWARYRPEVRSWAVGRTDRHRSRAAALAGQSATGAGATEVLLLAARMAAWGRNAEGLRALLEHATGQRVRVLENVPRLVRLGERPRLGRARLGVDAVVGATIHDETGKFRLEVGPLGLDAFRDLLPGGRGAARVDELVRHYTADALDYDLDLLLTAAEAPRLRLGDAGSAQLGRNAHVGTPAGAARPPPGPVRAQRVTRE